jgi:hypothetical protein
MDRNCIENATGKVNVDQESTPWEGAVLGVNLVTSEVDELQITSSDVAPLLSCKEWQLMQPGERTEQLAIFVEYLRNTPEFGARVIDDACYERCEAYVSCLIESGLVEETLIGRFFVLNPWQDRLLSAEKPLASDLGELQEWFAGARARGQLMPGSFFELEDLCYKVDNYGALRCTLNPGIYLDDNPNAFWGIAHVAPTIGSIVLDPSHPEGAVPLDSWMESLGASGLLPFYSSSRGHARLVPELLDQEALQLMQEALNAKGHTTTSSATITARELRETLDGMQQEERFALFDSILDAKITEGGLLPMRRWSRIYPGVLTMRGEVYGQFDPLAREKNENLFDGNWTRRLTLAKESLRPFATFQKLIEGAEYKWIPPESFVYTLGK